MALLASVAALLVVSLLAYGVARLYGAAVHGTENARTRLRRALAVALVASGVLGLLAFVGTGGLDAVERVFGEGDVGDAVGMLAMAAAVYVATLTCYLGFWPAIRAARDLDMTTTGAAVRVGRWLAAALGLFAVAVYALGHVPAGSVPGLLALGAVVVLTIYVGGGYVVRLAQSTREPTDRERERIETACEAADFDPHSVRVVETDETKWAGVLLRGPPRYRSLFVGSHLLSSYGDDALSVQVARTTGQARRGYVEAKFGAATALAIALLGLVVPLSGALRATLVGVGVVAAGILLWYGNRVLYAADADAADAVGVETVVETYRQVASDADQPLDSGGRLRNFLKMRPSLRRRIDRLEERAD